MQEIEFSLAGDSALIKGLRKLRVFRWIPQSVGPQMLLAAAIAWLPLFNFELVQCARFLVALPCTILLGELINPRLRSVLNSFLRNGIVTAKDFTRFENAVLRSSALAHSIIAELLILTLAYVYSALGLQRGASAGWWFRWVSMPMLIFGVLTWLWRLGVWAYLLFRISKLDLRVVATHPDGVGGLNFVNVGMRRFSLLVFGISSILCASIGEEILFKGTSLRSYELEMTLFFLVCAVIVLGPLMVFTPVLIRSKLDYWKMYGSLASRYVQAFDDKWISQTGYSRQPLLGSPDIQSLADLGHSYAGISEMRVTLLSRKTIGIFAVAYAIPALPLLASVISLRQIVSEVYSLLLK